MLFKEAVEFTSKIKDLEGILSIILFGSVARGESGRKSDIDLAIIYSKKHTDTIRKINSMASEKFQILHITLDELKDEPTLTGALSGEGIIMYGKPVTVTVEDMALKSKMIIAYDTSNLSQNQRNKLNRALFGGVSTYKIGEKRKIKHYPGIVDELPVQKIARSVFLLDRKNAPEITKTLKQFHAKWKEIPVWSY